MEDTTHTNPANAPGTAVDGPGTGRAGWLSDRLLRRLFTNASILLGGKSVNAVFGLAALAVAARGLGVEQFGVLVLIHAFTLAIGEIAKFQSWQAVLRYGTPALHQGRRGELQRLLRFTVFLDGLSAVVGVVLAVLIAWQFGTLFGWPAEAVPAAMAYVTCSMFMVTATPTGVLRLVDRFDLLAAQSTVAGFLRMAGGALAWVLGGGLGWFLVAWYVAQTAAGLFLIGVGWRELKVRGLLEGWRWRGGGLARGFPGIWGFVWATNLNATLELAFSHAGTLAVGWVLGPTQAALFRIAKQFADAIAKPAKLLVPAIYPELSRLWLAGDVVGIRQLMLRSALLAGLGATLIMGLVWLLGEWVLRLVIGPEFVPAFTVMLWLVGAAVLGIWAFPLEPLLVSTGHAAAALWIRLWASALYIPSLLLLLDRVGLIGAGWAALGASVFILAGLVLATVRWFKRPRSGSPPPAEPMPDPELS